MSRLDEAAKRVPADPASADDETQDNTDDLELDANPAGDAGDSDDEPGDKKERSAENVRGELLRKMKKDNEAMLQRLDNLATENATLRNQLTEPAANKGVQTPKTFDDMTIDELTAARPNIPAEQKEAFEEYLIDRKVDARVDGKLDKFQTKATFNDQEDRFNQQAYQRWPELRAKGSEFYGIADKILSEMGPSGKNNPRAVLDAANEAGLELGLSPAGVPSRSTRRSPGNVAPGRSTKGTNAPDLEASAEDKAIANRLQNAMPGKKFSEKQLKRIAKRSKMYKESINSHLRG